ncbi:MAG: hypothetical protein WAU00_01215, partial [Caldilinea sp.]
MFQIVQDQQQLPRAQELQQLLDGRARVAAPGRQIDAQRGSYGQHDEVARGDRGQVDEDDAVVEGAGLLYLLGLGYSQRQARLAHAARPGDGEQAYVGAAKQES